MSEALSNYSNEYLRLVLRKERGGALAYLSTLVGSKNLSLLQIFYVLASAQSEVGSLWEKGAASIADEHFATEVALDAIELFSNKFRKYYREKVGAALLADFVEGEYHVIGLKMFAELLRSNGWDVELYASPLNVMNILKHIEKSGKKFDLICCSVTMEFNLKELKNILKILRTNINTKNSLILVGSRLFTSKRVRELMTDEETTKPLADFLAKNFDEGIEFVRTARKVI
jgi:MerR family transcriptional regulator, light-induced transcriptional regulator